MKVCKKCGSQFNDTENFCNNCGQRLEDLNNTNTNISNNQFNSNQGFVQPTVNYSVPKKKSHAGLIITIIIVFILIVGAIVFALFKIFGDAINNSDKLVCTSNIGNITIFYNGNDINGYEATGQLTYNLDEQKEVAKIKGIDNYIIEFNSWFEKNTYGTCVNEKKESNNTSVNIDINTNSNSSSSNTKSSTSTNTDKSTSVTKSYKVGDAVTLLDGSKWHVLSTSGNNITLLLDELVANNRGYSDNGADEYHQKYENSDVKKYVEETYLPSLKTSLEKYNGDTTNLKARLIKADEFLSITGQDYGSQYLFSKTKFDATKEQTDSEKWLSLTDSFWTMNNVRDVDSSNTRYGAYAVKISNGTVMLWTDYSAYNNATGFTGSFFGIRPVIETTIKNIK